MKLNLKDRIYMPQIFPEKNNFMEFNLKKEIAKKIAITENDKKEYNIKEDAEEGRITWDLKKDLENPLCVDFTSAEKEYLKKCCESLSDQEYPDDFWMVVQKIYDNNEK